MSHRTVWLVALGGLLALLLAPVWILWCPGATPWRTHAYHTLLYDQIARRVTADARSTDERLERLLDYVQMHMWPAADVAPYEGKPIDYLVRGIGWCDYEAKTYMRLLAACDIPARYAMLRDASGVSPHTIAEVHHRGRWGAVDVLFGIRFTDAQGEPLSFEALCKTPSLLDAQPMVATLDRRLPDAAIQIRQVYDRVLPAGVPPRRSSPATQRLTFFDRAVVLYRRWVGQRFLDWYQDRYFASLGLSPPSTSAEALQLARHWHLAGRVPLARHTYQWCAQEAAEPSLRSEALFWLGLLQWELEGDAASAQRTFETLLAQDANSRWVPMAWYYLGRCEEDLGHPDRAQAWYAKAAVQGGIYAACRRGLFKDREPIGGFAAR